MREFLRYLFVVAAMLMVVVGDVWAECYVLDQNQVRVEYDDLDGNENGTYSSEYDINGPCATMTFSYRLDANSDATYWHRFVIEGKNNAGQWVELYNSGEIKNAGSKNVSRDISAYANQISKLRIKRTARKGWTAAFSGTKDVLVNNLKITRVVSISSNLSEWGFGTIEYSKSTPEKTFTVTYSNVGTTVTATSNSEHFSVTPTNPTFDNCSGSADFTIKYNPTAVGSHSGQITITCKDGNTTKGTITINVSGTAKGYPVFSWSGSGNYSYLVGDELKLSQLWTSSNTNVSCWYEIVTSTPSNIATLSESVLNLTGTGSLKIRINQAADGLFFADSKEITLTIRKRTANFAWTLNEPSYHVDDYAELVNIYTLKDDANGADVLNELHGLISFTSNNSNVVSVKQVDGKWVVYAENAGDATVTAEFKGNDKWNTFTAELPLNIIKYTPEFIWKDLSIHYDRTISNYFTTTSPNELTYSSSNEQVAILSQASSQALNLKTYNTAGSTKLIVSQAEDRKWYSKTEERTITPTDPNDHVPFTIDTDAKRDIFVSNYEAPEYSWNNGIQLGDASDGFNYNDKYVDIKFSGYPDKLTFNTSVVEAGLFPATDIYWYVKESVDGMTWSDVVWSEENTKQVSLEKPIQLKPETQYIRLCYSGNFGGVFHNIKVTELKQFSAEDKVDGDKHLDFGENQVQSTKTLKFDLKYTNVGYKVTAESNNNRFTVTPVTNTEIGGEKNGKYEYTVKYTSNVVYETTGDESYILLKDELGNSDKIYLHASSYKADQTITWREDFAAVEVPVLRKGNGQIAGAATASSGLIVTYTSADPTIIEVIGEGTILLPKKAGRVKITASQGGNALTWNAAPSVEKEFKVTEKLLQYIVWSESLTDFTEDDINKTVELNAEVNVQKNADTYDVEYSETQTAKVTYVSAAPSIVSVDGKILTIHGTGQTTLTVSVPENENYAAATLKVPVWVKANAVGCEDVLLLNHKDELQFFEYNTNEIVQGPFAIDREKGVPGALSFQHYGASWDLAIQYYKGTIKAQYITDNNSNWVDAIEVEPKEDETTYESNIVLPRNATQIRFVRPSGGQGYHYVSNIQVHPAQYLETNDELDFGEILVGSTITKELEVDFSNIKQEIHPQLSSSDLSVDTKVFGHCGAFGVQKLNISWHPVMAVGDVQETLVLNDELSGMTKTVTLKAVVIKANQTVTWTRPSSPITTCVEFPEKTDVDVSIAWEVIDGEDYAQFDGNILSIYKNGQIKVQGTAVETDNYNAFSIVYKYDVVYKPTFLGNETGDWSDAGSWNICRVPDADEVVTIVADVNLITFSQFKGLNIEEDAVVYIQSTGGLTIGKEGIRGAKEGSISIDNTPEGAGFLRVDPTTDNKPAKVTVNYTTRAKSGDANEQVWQYVGAPGENPIMSSTENAKIYYWSETEGWVKHATAFEPFKGYAISQKNNENDTYTIAATPILANHTVELTKTPKGMNGDNLFVNSYLAPIDLTKFTDYDDALNNPDDDFIGDFEKTFYLFNSGSLKDCVDNGGKGSEELANGSSPGQYYAITPLGTAFLDQNVEQTTIPPMQGVYVVANENNAKIRLNYEKHVFKTEPKNMNHAMRAPQEENENFMRVRLQVNSPHSGADRMYVIQHENTTRGYDNGYDAKNIIAQGQPNIYTNEVEGQMEISVADQIDSTYIGFTAGEDTQYTLTFTSLVGDEFYLHDLEADSLISLAEGGQYVFTAQPNSVNDMRFVLLLQNKADNTPGGGVVTGVDNVISSARIWVNDKRVYIADAPQNSTLSVYTISGMSITSPLTIHHAPCTIDLSHLPTGVYVLRLNNQAYKFVCE